MNLFSFRKNSLCHTGHSEAKEQTKIYSQKLAAIKIQKVYRGSLQRNFPRMTDLNGESKNLPKLVESDQGIYWGARKLSISNLLLGEGSYAKVYAGQLGALRVAIKDGDLPEMEYLQKLLKFSNDINMVIPIPLCEDVVSSQIGKAIMPRMEQTLDSKSDSLISIGLEKAVELAYKLEQLSGLKAADIKPSNILLDKEGCIYLADFGIMVDKNEVW